VLDVTENQEKQHVLQTEAELDAKYSVQSPKKSLASKIGAGILGAVSLFGAAQEAEAGGATMPSPEKMQEIQAQISDLEARYKQEFGKNVTLKFRINTIDVDYNGYREIGRIDIPSYSLGKWGDQSQKDQTWNDIKDIPTFDIEREVIAFDLKGFERANLIHPIETPEGEVLVEFSKYGYATVKLAGAKYDMKTGTLSSPDGTHRFDFTLEGKNKGVKIYGEESKMNIIVCTKKDLKDKNFSMAYQIELHDGYRDLPLSPGDVLDKCK
jgi:hypothetical protein